MTTNIHVRGIDDYVATCLKKAAHEKKISLNALIVNLLRQSLGLDAKQHISNCYHDLDQLAGTWDKKEMGSFRKTAEDFERIDQEIWK